MMRATSALSAAEIASLRAFVRGHDLFRFYVEAALADLERGVDNRVVYVRPDGKGVILGITFESLAAFTPIGELSEAELSLTLCSPLLTEVHAEPRHEPMLRRLCGARLLSSRELRIYRHEVQTGISTEGVRRAQPEDFGAMREFLARHNPRNAFADWMLALPFMLMEQDGAIVALAGTIARHGDVALIGHFLTRPDRRGRGHALRLATALATVLNAEGASSVMLATTADNLAACRAYEKAGFRITDVRRQLDVTPAVVTSLTD